MHNNSKTIMTNLMWRFLERCGSQGVTFIVSIVLARLLAPEVYGTIALVTVFTTLLQVFVNSGFGTSLIQKKDADDVDFSTVFYFNIIFSASLYVVMFFAAPAIAGFYNNLELIPVIRVLTLVVIVSGVRNVQQAFVSRNMMFKRFFWSTLGGTLSGAAVGIYIAWAGYGVWALVGQQLTNAIVDTLILWVTVKWRPKLLFSFKRLKSLFSYGWKLLVSSLIDTLYNDMRQLIIGKLYSSNDLAFYNRGKQFPNLVATNINASIDSVLLPAMSSAQDNKETVKAMTRRAIKTATYIIMPLMVGLAVCAEPIVRLILTDKWLPCVPFMQIFCITLAFYPIHTANLNAIKAMGRSDLFLKLEIIKKVVGLALLFSTMWISPLAMAYSTLVGSVASQIINSWPNKKLLGYSYLEQLKDIAPNIALAVFMGICVYCIQFLNLPVILILIIQVILGAILYVLGSKLFKLDSFEYVLSILKKFKHKRG
ncbi:MAG: lipopolysaccharide biosynthesis protein [Ruminococcaceae bacterium]|nr:lipopolysaccharide biosynthesis protein [Oscillospiraceae bacterium]